MSACPFIDELSLACWIRVYCRLHPERCRWNRRRPSKRFVCVSLTSFLLLIALFYIGSNVQGKNWIWALNLCDLTVRSRMAGTKIQGYQKRELNDPWAPAQLWVIAQVGTSDLYTIENTNSRTYLQLGMVSLAHSQRLYSWICIDSNANGAPIAGYNSTGKPDQQWAITRNSTHTSYV